MGLILSCYASAASMRDEWRTVWALDALKSRGSRLHLLRADAGYPGALTSSAWRVLGRFGETVRRTERQNGFVVLGGHLLVEYTLGLGQPEKINEVRRYSGVVSPNDSAVHDAPSSKKPGPSTYSKYKI